MRESTDWKVPCSNVRLTGHAGGTLVNALLAAVWWPLPATSSRRRPMNRMP